MLQTSASFRNDLNDCDNSISLSEIISALSYALDLTEGAVHGHALRSCLLGMRIAAEAWRLREAARGAIAVGEFGRDMSQAEEASNA